MSDLDFEHDNASFEAWLRYIMQAPLTDEDIDRALADAPPVQMSDDFKKRAMAAMERAQRKRDVDQWIQEALR